MLCWWGLKSWDFIVSRFEHWRGRTGAEIRLGEKLRFCDATLLKKCQIFNGNPHSHTFFNMDKIIWVRNYVSTGFINQSCRLSAEQDPPNKQTNNKNYAYSKFISRSGRVQTQKHHITLNNSSPLVHSNHLFHLLKKKSNFPINSDEKVKCERLKDTGHLTSCTKECTRRRFRLMLECHIESFRFHRETLWNLMLRNATMTMQIWQLRKRFIASPKL